MVVVVVVVLVVVVVVVVVVEVVVVSLVVIATTTAAADVVLVVEVVVVVFLVVVVEKNVVVEVYSQFNSVFLISILISWAPPSWMKYVFCACHRYCLTIGPLRKAGSLTLLNDWSVEQTSCLTALNHWSVEEPIPTSLATVWAHRRRVQQCERSRALIVLMSGFTHFK